MSDYLDGLATAEEEPINTKHQKRKQTKRFARILMLSCSLLACQIGAPVHFSTANAASQKAAPAKKEMRDIRAKYFGQVLKKIQIAASQSYSKSLKKAGIQGRVLLRFSIQSNGVVKSLRVYRSSRNKELDAAALNALKSASPFPHPPKSLSRDDLTLTTPLVFHSK